MIERNTSYFSKLEWIPEYGIYSHLYDIACNILLQMGIPPNVINIHKIKAKSLESLLNRIGLSFESIAPLQLESCNWNENSIFVCRLKSKHPNFAVLKKDKNKGFLLLDTKCGWHKLDLLGLLQNITSLIYIKPIDHCIAQDLIANRNQDSSFIQSMRIYDDFLSDRKCEELTSYTRDKFAPSKIIDLNGEIQDSGRASQSFQLPIGNEFCKLIYNKLEDLTNVSENQFEPIQCITYGIGGQYRNHFDAFTEDFSDELKKGQRIITCLLYLTEDEEDHEGGETYFPNAGVLIPSKKGRLVIFKNVLSNGELDSMSLHAGRPVRKGRKVICTVWARDKRYTTNN